MRFPPILLRPSLPRVLPPIRLGCAVLYGRVDWPRCPLGSLGGLGKDSHQWHGTFFRPPLNRVLRGQWPELAPLARAAIHHVLAPAERGGAAAHHPGTPRSPLGTPDGWSSSQKRRCMTVAAQGTCDVRATVGRGESQSTRGRNRGV